MEVYTHIVNIKCEHKRAKDHCHWHNTNSLSTIIRILSSITYLISVLSYLIFSETKMYPRKHDFS